MSIVQEINLKAISQFLIFKHIICQMCNIVYKLQMRQKIKNFLKTGQIEAKEEKQKPIEYDGSFRFDKGGFLTQKHLQFFYKYGFVLVKGIHTKQQIEKAKEGANHLIKQAQKMLDWGKGQWAFDELPEGLRSKWGKCKEPRLVSFFDYPQNNALCRSVIGDFPFKHYDGPGFYTFAPRFYNWSLHPQKISKNQSKTIPAYNPNNLPNDMEKWSQDFIRNCAELGIKLAPPTDENWHLDSQNYNNTMLFSMLWGSYINKADCSGMGNLHIYPGTHHVLADIMRKQGLVHAYDGSKQTAPPRPNLKRQGIADGKPYALCVEEGDVLLAHPWLAHGVGINTSDQTRLAVYCRTYSHHFWKEGRAKVAGKKIGYMQCPPRWTGDYWQNLPELNKWFKTHKEQLRQYDKGQLDSALKSL